MADLSQIRVRSIRFVRDNNNIQHRLGQWYGARVFSLTLEDIAKMSDEEILRVPWLGPMALESIRATIENYRHG